MSIAGIVKGAATLLGKGMSKIGAKGIVKGATKAGIKAKGVVGSVAKEVGETGAKAGTKIGEMASNITTQFSNTYKSKGFSTAFDELGKNLGDGMVDQSKRLANSQFIKDVGKEIKSNKITNNFVTNNPLTRGLGNIGKYVAKNTFTLENAADTFLGKKLKLTKFGVGMFGLGTVAMLGYNTGETTLKAYERSKYGEIEGGYIPNTINATFSPTHSQLVDYAMSGEKGMKEFTKKTNAGDGSRRLAQVDPEIVFALHELRNSNSNYGGEY